MSSIYQRSNRTVKETNRRQRTDILAPLHQMSENGWLYRTTGDQVQIGNVNNLTKLQTIKDGLWLRPWALSSATVQWLRLCWRFDFQIAYTAETQTRKHSAYTIVHIGQIFVCRLKTERECERANARCMYVCVCLCVVSVCLYVLWCDLAKCHNHAVIAKIILTYFVPNSFPMSFLFLPLFLFGLPSSSTSAPSLPSIIFFCQTAFFVKLPLFFFSFLNQQILLILY